MLDEAGRPVLKLRVAAAPTDGSANASVIALLAKTLKLPKSSVQLVAGENARVKRLEIDADAERLAAAFGNPSGQQKL